MGWFKCKHPFHRLEIQRSETSKPEEEGFEQVTYHLACTKCGTELELGYIKCVGGVEALLARKARMKREAEQNGNRKRA